MSEMKPGMLIIDDDTSFIRAIRASFIPELDVHHASTGQDAFKALKQKDIEICLVDYRLPDVDGLQVLKTLREMYPYIPAIFISGYLTEDVKEKAHSFDYGAYYVLAKPVDPDVLMRCVQVCLEEGGKAWANKILKQYKKHHPWPSVIWEKELDHERCMVEIVNMVRKEPKKWMTSQLASRFGVTQRQIQEDIHILIERGIPICRCGWRLYIDEDEKSAS